MLLVINAIARVNNFERRKLPDRTIQGTVNDANTSLPIEGVTITVKGTTIATKTDSRGEFTLSAPDNSKTLVISSIGYTSTEIPVNSGSISVKLTPSATDLSEVVVVGYETMKKSDLTGAITTIDADKLDKASAPDVSRMLQGKVAGLQILQNSAQPGGGLDILIRGGGSINASNRPLFVVDGFPIYETGQPEGTDPLRYYTEGSLGTLNSLNPNDIQTVTVLKDASATAIYGSRAANGVVLITTKRGATGEAKISYSGNYSVQPYENRWKLLPFKT
ncbi:MAG TPA: TonB-dependent receptor plug domain-containing protein [Chryseolinea sp.]|nr:TonB-dependent receptor plug domain-containing protein [Chryseolinea sp.]